MVLRLILDAGETGLADRLNVAVKNRNRIILGWKERTIDISSYYEN